MNDVDDVDFIRSQLTIARWHLEQMAAPDPDRGTDHVREAIHAYQTAIDLLPTLKISGTRRVQLVTELAELRDRLRGAGADVQGA